MNACHAAGEAMLMCLEDAEGDVNTATAQLPVWTAQDGTILWPGGLSSAPEHWLGSYMKPVSAK